MPPLKGTFDPAKFNATMLAERIAQSVRMQLGIATEINFIDACQDALDNLAREGVIR